MSIEKSNNMCSPDNNASGQSIVRAPLESLPTQPINSSSSAHALEAETVNASQQRTMKAVDDGEVKEAPSADMNCIGLASSSFELEDATVGSGGTSWTLRVPWLRNKRHRKLRLDDENNSIQTFATSSHSIYKPTVLGSPDQNSIYYGGLMKTTTSNIVINGSENIDALVGDGLYQLTTPESQASRVLHQKEKPQRLAKPTAKERRKLSTKKIRQKAFFTSSLHLDQNLLPQHNTHPPSPSLSAAAAAATTTTIIAIDSGLDTAGAEQHFILQSAPRLEHKNTNKVFRNRSWISTSSRESSVRQNDMDEDSLADFNDAEWTPQDSAYGAAIPVCGWVPKRLRQVIEATIISFAVFVLGYLIVKTSINISEGKEIGSHPSYNESSISSARRYYNGFDDDWYVENSHSTYNDEYFNNYDSYNSDGDNGNGGNYKNNDGNHGG